MFRRATLSVVLLVTLLTSGLSGQTLAKRAAIPQPAPAQPFDSSLDTLPRYFSGQNAEAIYDLIKATIPDTSKSEFETQAEYATRLEALSSRSISGKTRVSDIFAFSLTGSAWSEPVSPDVESVGRNVATQYNAEAGILAVTLPSYASYLPNELASQEHYWHPLWRTSHRPLGVYTAETAFGVRRRISRWRKDDVVIVVHADPTAALGDDRTKRKWMSTDCQNELGFSLSCSLALDAVTARAVSSSLMALIIGRPTAPFISEQSYVISPTVEAPGEIRVRTKFLHVRLEQLWLADRVTGRVLRKYNHETRTAENMPVLAGPVRVGGKVPAPLKVRHVEPVYPPIAIAARIQGEVVIEATIDASGNIRDARVVHSVPLLDGAALDAVRLWKYSPTVIDGVPVSVTVTTTHKFTLTVQ